MCSLVVRGSLALKIVGPCTGLDTRQGKGKAQDGREGCGKVDHVVCLAGKYVL
jgi:hypothetical protein